MELCENCGVEKGTDTAQRWCPHSMDGGGRHVFTDHAPLTMKQWFDKRARANQVRDRDHDDPRQMREQGLAPIPPEEDYERATDDAPEAIREHLREAYRFATGLILTPPILDIGSGDGWGAVCMRAVGLDPHEPTYPIPWVKGTAPFATDNIANQTFGTVTCFQTIEHLKRELHVPLVGEMQRLSSGDILISTVNKNVDPSILGEELYIGEKNKYHKYEYSVEAFHFLEILFHHKLWDVNFYWQRAIEFIKWERDMKIEVSQTERGLLATELETFPISMLLWARRKQPEIPISPDEVEVKT